MASELFSMLADLAKDPKKLDKFHSDPATIMDKYGLSTTQKRLMKSASRGNQQDFLKAVGDEAHAKLKRSRPILKSKPREEVI